jgi:hypothetical protein
METAQIWVDDLGEPVAPPDALGQGDEAWATDLRRDLEGGAEDWVGWATERMIPAAQAGYRLAGVASAIVLRVPIDRAWEVWATEPDEVRPVVAAILPVVPRTELARFVIARLPAMAAVVQGAGLALDRIRETRALRDEESTDDRGSRSPRRERESAYAGVASAAELARRSGVGSIPFAEPTGDRGGPERDRGLAGDEWTVDVARSGGDAPDGTIADPALIRHLVGGHRDVG